MNDEAEQHADAAEVAFSVARLAVRKLRAELREAALAGWPN